MASAAQLHHVWPKYLFEGSLGTHTTIDHWISGCTCQPNTAGYYADARLDMPHMQCRTLYVLHAWLAVHVRLN